MTRPKTHLANLNNCMEDAQSPGSVAPESPDNSKHFKKIDKKISIKSEPIQDTAINEVLKDALRAYIKNKNTVKKTELELEAMVATCQEFLQCFIIFGYDFNGNPIAPIFSAHNQQEADALSMYLSKFFNAHINNSGQNGTMR